MRRAEVENPHAIDLRLAEHGRSRVSTAHGTVENVKTRDDAGHGFTWSLSHFRPNGPGIVDVESSREPNYVYTQVALDGGFEAELTCGTTYAHDSTGLVRPGASTARFRTSGRGVRMFGVLAEIGSIEHWFGDRMPAPVRGLLNGAGRGTFHSPKSTPAHLRQILLQALASETPMRRYLIEATAFQLLGFQLEHLAQQDQSAVSPADRSAAQEGYALIAAAPDRAPTLNDLARDLNVAPARLDRAFRAVFGQSVFQTTLNLRYEAICAALLAGEPIKVVAGRFGYTSVSNFSSAFRRKMGLPPRQWISRRVR